MEDGTRVKEGIISTFDLCIEVGDAESGSLKLVQLIKPKWSAEDIKLKRFTGGITNTLLGCWHKDDLDQKEMVLIRIYGANTDLIIDRAAEMRNIQLLHAVGCARPLYARFANGIAYGFFPGKCVDEITVRDPVISRLIAQEMVKVHSIDPDEVMKQSQIPGPFITQKPMVFDRCWKWLDLIPDKFSDAEKNKRYKSEVCSKLQLRRELEELQPHLESINSPVVFCHNDLLLANIVYNDKKGVLGFIDFEYGAFNYEAYDIGNHFAEYAGVETTDYSLYPDRDYQLKWLQTFLEFKATQKGSSSTKVTDHDVEVLYVQVNKFALAPIGQIVLSGILLVMRGRGQEYGNCRRMAINTQVQKAAHFFWGIWALIQACHSTIDFDYLDYSILRFNEYFAKRDAFLSLKMPA